MELVIFARFHANEGGEDAWLMALREQVRAVSAEPGCHWIGAYRSARDPQLFCLHSRWTSEGALEVLAELAGTMRVVQRIQAPIDYPFDAARAHPITEGSP